MEMDEDAALEVQTVGEAVDFIAQNWMTAADRDVLR